MQREHKCSYSADFDQFSKFLRGTHRGATCPRMAAEHSVVPCQSDSEPICGQRQSLAMVYAVKQDWQGIYDPEIALVNGTLFEELNLPFERSGCSMNNGCRGNNGGACR